MAFTWQADTAWRSVFSVALIYALGEIAAYHLLQQGGKWTTNLPEDLRPEPDPLYEETKSHFHFYFKHLPAFLLTKLGQAIRDYEWQCWLEKTYPGWVFSKSDQDAIVHSGPQAEKLGDLVDEELEEEMLKRLIAKGKAQLPSPWLNTVAKWVLDNVVAVTVFGITDALVDSIFAGDSSPLFAHLMVGIWANPVLHFFSTKPLVSFISFVFFPVKHRVTFLAAVDVVMSFFFNVLINGGVAWVMKQEWAVELMRNVSAAAGNFSNPTVEWNGVNLVDQGKVHVNMSESVNVGGNGTMAWEGGRALGDEL